MGGDERITHAHQARPKALRADGLRPHPRALQQQVQFVGQHFRLVQTGRPAQPHEPLVIRGFHFFDHRAHRVVFLRQLDRRIRDRAAARSAVGDAVCHVFEPQTQLRKRVAGWRRS